MIFQKSYNFFYVELFLLFYQIMIIINRANLFEVALHSEVLTFEEIYVEEDMIVICQKG